jgi:hypothetical protein
LSFFFFKEKKNKKKKRKGRISIKKIKKLKKNKEKKLLLAFFCLHDFLISLLQTIKFLVACVWKAERPNVLILVEFVWKTTR